MTHSNRYLVLEDVNLLEEGVMCPVRTDKHSLMLLRRNGQVHCMDLICYHNKATLSEGLLVEVVCDIEDLHTHRVTQEKKLCVQCPGHKRLFDVETGKEMLDKASDNMHQKSSTYTCGPVRQRTHRVEVTPTGQVYVHLNSFSHSADIAVALDVLHSKIHTSSGDFEPEISSDKYSCAEIPGVKQFWGEAVSLSPDRRVLVSPLRKHSIGEDMPGDRPLSIKIDVGAAARKLDF
eukprot:TRINITY_DN18925_c0_g1::TRINITY_DN18925_c0_g1_i1::g.1512::m.1512 TRINITY_DN18925_c0_g1::TRINITY_DN18925_c0_g1_i1::g.1512  ORF type:complete len:234 (-),score=28.76,Rieske/PF00355.21/2.4e-05,Rieske_2/PF13806.1/0.044,Rieske_2/PF13806.1/5.6e+03 TRINITY_DN18925_c0_g1_i1:215-916(-)